MEKKTKILIPVLSIKHHGGIRILIEIANELSTWANVEFIVPKGHVNTDYQINDSVKISEIPTRVSFKIVALMIFLIRSIFYMRRGEILVGNFFVCYFPVLIASILFNKKKVYIVQGIESIYSKKNIIGILLNHLCEFTYREKNIITVNDYLRKNIERKGVKPIFSFSIGVAQNFYTTINNTSVKEFDFIFFARSELWKNLDFFYSIVEKVGKRLSFLIVSKDFELLKQIEKRFDGYKIKTISPKDQVELVEMYDNSKLYLLTSSYEGFSLPPLEAMSRGLPVLVTMCGGPELYVKNGENGFFFTDKDDLIEKADLLLSDENVYNKMSACAVNTSEKFNLAEGISSLSTFLKSFSKSK